MVELYTWQVRCEGSTWIQEYDDERPDGRGFAEVKDHIIKCIDLIPASSEGHVHSVAIPEGATPVFFRRRTIELSQGGQNRSTAHCIGWEKENNKSYLFVMEDGTTLLTDDLQAV